MPAAAVLDVLRDPGGPLASPVRQEMEDRFDADFSDVRLHTGPAVRASAAAVGARAYTSGSHIVFGEGGVDSHTLAHELAHVIQQRQGPVAGTDDGSGLRVSDPSDRFERAAEAVARHAIRGPLPRPRRSLAPGQPGPRSALVVQRVQIARGYGKNKVVVWDTDWTDEEKEKRFAGLTPEDAESITGNRQFQEKEGDVFKERIRGLAAERAAEKDPRNIGVPTTGDSAPHRKTPQGRTRVLRVAYAPHIEKIKGTAEGHIVFLVEHAIKLGFTVMITTTKDLQETLLRVLEKEFNDADWRKVLRWDFVPSRKELYRWVEDNVEYLESGMQVQTRHFAGTGLEHAMREGRRQRPAWASQGPDPGESSLEEAVPLGTKVNDPELRGSKEGQALRRRIRAYVEGGNMISGEDAHGRQVILVGRDSIHATAVLYHIEPLAVCRVLAEDFGVQPGQIVPVEQPGKFHLDMGMLFIGRGVVIVNDSRAAVDVLREGKPKEILRTIVALEEEAVKDLVNADLKVIRKPLASNIHNFFNGEFVEGNDGKTYFLTNGGSAEQQEAFREFLQDYGVADVFFTPAEVAHSTLTEDGGLGCRVKGVPAPAMRQLLEKIEGSEEKKQ